MNSREAERKNNRKEYYAELKENGSFLVGIGGAIIGLIIFHYSIYKIREAEFFNVNTDMINQSTVVDGIGKFSVIIVGIVGLLSLYLFLSYYARKKLSGSKVELKDNKMKSTVVIILAVIFGTISAFIIFRFNRGFKGDMPETRYAFSVLCVLIIIHILVSVWNFVKTKYDEGNKTILDVPVIVQFLYIAVMFLFYLCPFIYTDNQITSTDSITVTVDNRYMLVEKNQGEVVLREMKPKGNLTENEFYLTDKYIPMDAKKIVFKEQPIMETVNFEKEGFLKFEVEGKN